MSDMRGGIFLLIDRCADMQPVYKLRCSFSGAILMLHECKWGLK